jgi:hypothetical protein
MPDKFISNNTTYLYYDFARPIDRFVDLQNTKDLFFEAEVKPIVVIDVSFEGESGSYLGGINNCGTGLVGISTWIDPTSSTLLEALHSLLSEYESDKLVLVYGDARIEKNYTTWCKLNKVDRIFGKCVYRPNTLLQRSLDHYKENNMQPNNLFKSKHFICMNGYSKAHRFHMVELLYVNDWHTKGYISYLNRNGSDETLSTQNFQGQKLCLDFDSEEIGIDNNQLLLPPQYSDACFDIVTESMVDDNGVFITEKTWKPILNKTPFIPLGPKGMCKHLEEYFGIKPYTDLFDYNFDNVDYPERLHRIKEDNLDRLLNMDIHELNEIVNSDKMQELLEYNKARMLSHYKPEYMGDTSSKMKTLIDSINQTQA